MSTGGRPRGRRGRARDCPLALIAMRLAAAGGERRARRGPEVVVLPTTGIVDDGMAKYLADNIAGRRGARRRGRRDQAEHAGRRPDLDE